MEFKVNSGIWGSMFGVPDVVADNFLKLASGDQIKVLLYILRCSGRVCTDEEISINTGVSVQAAADAVLFWQQANVLTSQSVSPAKQQTIMAPPPQQPQNIMMPPPQPIQHEIEKTASTVPEVPVKAERRTKQNISPSEIAQIMKDSVDVSELFKVTETILGPINHTFQNLLIWMYDYLGLKKEVIIILISHCKSMDKTNPSYIEKVAMDWADNDINDLEKAQSEVQRITVTNDYTGRIMKMFEMTRRPTSKQAEFIEQWRCRPIDTELIRYAYEKTIEQINKLSFDYINKILISWCDSGYTSVQQVREAENDYRSSKKKNIKASGDPDVDKYKVVINQF